MTPYAAELVFIIADFRFDPCKDCGLNADRHIYSRDEHGNPRAWCLSQDAWHPGVGADPNEYRRKLARIITTDTDGGKACPECALPLDVHTIAINCSEDREDEPVLWCPENEE